MNPTHENFKASIQSLENLNTEYTQTKKSDLELRSPTQVQISPTVSTSNSTLNTTNNLVVTINDYVRMCRIYCIMLWTYWETLKLYSANLEELKLIRNCLVHHGGDITKYSQSAWAIDGTKLMNLSVGKTYAVNNILVMTEADVIYFTNLIKTEFTAQTGVSF